MRLVGGEIELLYVDSDSSDGSAARAEALGARVLRVSPSRPCAAIGRNAGWKAASARFVLFLDGDTVLHPDFVARALPFFDDSRVAVVWGHRRESRTAQSAYNRALDLDWIYAPGPTEFCGGDALMRREVLERTGGFDEGLIAGEEPELCRRIRAEGLQILHVDLPMTLHDLAMTRASQWWRRAFRAGYAYAEVSERFRASALPLWSEDARRHRRHAAAVLGLALGALTALAVGAWPLTLFALAAFTALVLRTAWRARWKRASTGTLLLSGLHSQLQHVPILCGQLAFQRDRRAGRWRGLIDYKETPP
jgi:cellulose synthase/poly-beta-1,6-N-acetylglucosamine synthase-like glycosyltransferase